MVKKNGLSVVMAVYKNDKPEWVELAINSILDQTHKANEVIVVCDGLVADDLRNSLDSYGKKIKQILLPENKGLWNALNVGIDNAQCDLIARMDADDISFPDRFEKQLAEFTKDRNLDLLGGQLVEFTDNTKETGKYRTVPPDQEGIIRFSRYRSPFNHPTVMFRKKSVQAVGGYNELYRTEDYDLWIRMIQAGMRMKNLDDTLLYYRVNRGNSNRKSSNLQYRESMAMQKRIRKSGMLSWHGYVVSRTARRVFHYLPGSLKDLIYRKCLRTIGGGGI